MRSRSLGARESAPSVEFQPGFTAWAVGRAFRQWGAVVLRQVVDRSRVTELASDVLAAFVELDRRRARLSSADRRTLDRMEMPVADGDRSFRIQHANYAVLDAPRLVDALEGLAGPFLWHVPPQIRRQRPDVPQAYLPFHQDDAYTRHYRQFIVCWTPLTACGADAPGLEIALGRVEEALEHQARGLWEAAIPAERLDAVLRHVPRYAPVLEPGDVVLFDSRTLHRTYVPHGVRRPRLSIDFRAAPCAAIPDEVRRQRTFIDPKEIAYV